MRDFRFVDWKVYKDAKELFKILVNIIHALPQEYRFEMGNQLQRSGLSVVLNIAEGCGKSSDRELNRFLNISSGSLFEVLATVDVMHDMNLVREDVFLDTQNRIGEISRQIGGLKKKLSK